MTDQKCPKCGAGFSTANRLAHVDITGPMYCDVTETIGGFRAQATAVVRGEIERLRGRVAYLEEAVRVRDRQAVDDETDCDYGDPWCRYCDKGTESHYDSCPTITHPLDGGEGG